MHPRSAQTVDVTRTYLELRGRSSLRVARAPLRVPVLEPRRPITADEYLALYGLVGERWHWRDRFAWPEGLLDAHLASPAVHVWSATVGNALAGYFELQDHHDGAVELMYFGLTAQFIGQGIGGWLLTRAAETAFSIGAQRVILNTCTLDGPHALPNYIARGFTILRDEVYQVTLPAPGTAYQR